MNVQTALAAAWTAAVLSAGPAAAADLEAAVGKLGGTHDAAAGRVVVKKNKTPDLAALKALGEAGGVRSLVLDGCGLKSDGVAVIAGFKGLQELHLTHTMVNKVEDVAKLAAIPGLETLDLGGSNFGDAGLKALAASKDLRHLRLGHVGRDDRNHFTAEGLKALADLPRLEELVLHLHKPDEAMIPVLAGLKTVKELTVGGVSAEFHKKLAAALPQAKVRIRGKPVPAK